MLHNKQVEFTQVKNSFEDYNIKILQMIVQLEHKKITE